MIQVNGFDELVVSRMGDFFRQGSFPWARRLWSFGTILTLEEVLEASEAVRASVLSQEALNELKNSAKHALGSDPGISPEQQETIHASLSDKLPYEGVAYRALRLGPV